jgi:hypothetical protein
MPGEVKPDPVSEVSDYVGARIGRSIVDYDYLFVLPGLVQRALDALTDPPFRVIAGDQDGN